MGRGHGAVLQRRAAPPRRAPSHATAPAIVWQPPRSHPLAPRLPPSPGRFVNLVFSNDLHEVHGYNRLADVSRGRVVILMQDDDMPPETCSWVKYVLWEFEKRPKLGAVGAGRRAHDATTPRSALPVLLCVLAVPAQPSSAPSFSRRGCPSSPQAFGMR